MSSPPPPTAAAPDPVVVARGLRRSFGRNEALAGIDLAIPPGAVGLLGPNGAGKSTLLKILLGLLEPSSGEARVLGVDPVADPVGARRSVGYMPEVDSYVTGLTAVESVRLAGVLGGMRSRDALERAHFTLSYCGLGEARYRKVEEYSTGMRQRVRLAQALVHDPPLLFLDEPTNGLDPEGREEILGVVRDLARVHAKNIVLCSHLLRDVESTCGHMVFLSAGRVAREGSLESLLRGRRGAFRVTLRGESGPLEEALRAAGAAVEPGEGCLRVLVPGEGDATAVVAAAAACGADLRGVVPDALTLEDAFVAAMGPGPASPATGAA